VKLTLVFCCEATARRNEKPRPLSRSAEAKLRNVPARSNTQTLRAARLPKYDFKGWQSSVLATIRTINQSTNDLFGERGPVSVSRFLAAIEQCCFLRGCNSMSRLLPPIIAGIVATFLSSCARDCAAPVASYGAPPLAGPVYGPSPGIQQYGLPPSAPQYGPPPGTYSNGAPGRPPYYNGAPPPYGLPPTGQYGAPPGAS
jgi:hypothetical protein